MSTKYIPMAYETMDEFARQLYYLEEENVIVNEFGSVVFNIYDYITPNEFMLFKKNKDYMLITKGHVTIELVYPDFNYDRRGEKYV